MKSQYKVGFKQGQLEIIASLGKTKVGKRYCNNWMFHCHQCGRDEEIPQIKFVRQKPEVCSVCLKGPCSVCGGDILTEVYKTTCSEACHTESRRAKDREYKRQLHIDNPDLSKQQYKKRIEKIKEDPALYEAHLEKDRLRSQNKRNNDESREALNQQARERYEKNKGDILNKRKQKKSQLSEQEKEIVRQNNRDHYQENKEKISIQRKTRFDNLTEEQQNELKEFATTTVLEVTAFINFNLSI